MSACQLGQWECRVGRVFTRPTAMATPVGLVKTRPTLHTCLRNAKRYRKQGEKNGIASRSDRRRSLLSCGGLRRFQREIRADLCELLRTDALHPAQVVDRLEGPSR